MSKPATREIRGLTFRFKRRRYGSQTYTWAEVLADGVWLDLGDPWPAVMPKHDELHRWGQARINEFRFNRKQEVGA